MKKQRMLPAKNRRGSMQAIGETLHRAYRMDQFHRKLS